MKLLVARTLNVSAATLQSKFKITEKNDVYKYP